MTCGSNQPSLQEHCKLGLKWAETGRNKGKLLDFWNSTGRKQQSCLAVNKCYLFFKKRKECSYRGQILSSSSGQGHFLCSRARYQPSGPGGQSIHPPQKDYALKLQNLIMDFAVLGFLLAWDLWPFFLSFLLSPFLNN